MAASVEFWLYVLANLFVLLVGAALVVLSVAAYRRTSDRQFGFAAVGFATVTLGSLIELVFDLLNPGAELGSPALLGLRTIESVLIGLGLLVLFYSLVTPRRP